MAATTELNILVRLKDEASKAISGIGKELQGLATATQPAALASKAVAAGLLGIGAAGAAGAVVAVNAARETMKVNNQLEAVLKSTGGAAQLTKDDILEHSAALAKLTNFEDDAVTSAQNLLLTFTNIKGPVFQQATETMLDMAAAMGTDAKGGAIQLGKALNDPIAGISALSRVGVTFNDEQKKTIENLVKTGKTAEAQKVILAELAKEFGGSAAAQLDPILKLKQSFGELAEQIGLKLLPFVNKMAEAALKFTTDILPQWIDRSKEIIQWIKEHTWVIGIVAGAIIGALIPAVIAWAAAMVPLIAAFVASAIALAPFLIGGAIIGGIVMGVLWLIKHWDLVIEKATMVWAWVVEKFTALKDSVVEIFTSIGEFFKTIWDFYIGIWKFAIALAVGLVIEAFKLMGVDIVDVFRQIGEFFSAFWQALVAAWNASLTFISQLWNTVWTAIGNFIGPIWETIKSGITAAWDYIKNIFNAATEPVKGAWESMWNGIKGVFDSVWGTIKDSLSAGLNWMIDKINKVIQGVNRIASSGAGALGINVSKIPEIPKLAKGGIVTRPTLALIGEAGPEAVVPLSRGGGTGGIGGMTININGPIYTGKEQALLLVEEVAKQVKRRILVT